MKVLMYILRCFQYINDVPIDFPYVHAPFGSYVDASSANIAVPSRVFLRFPYVHDMTMTVACFFLCMIGGCTWLCASKFLEKRTTCNNHDDGKRNDSHANVQVEKQNVTTIAPHYHIYSEHIQSMNLTFPLQTRKLPEHDILRILVTGGAGFVGSNLVDRLMTNGHRVIVVDNLFTGRKQNVQHWIGHPNFTFILHDVVDKIQLEVDQIYHLACPASPPHYQYNPIKTIKTSALGTLNMLGLAKRVNARILLASTSEIYGDPKEHPQKETYRGHVNPIGPRANYDEGKRIAETMMYAYHQQEGVDVRVARIFNTFGPRMHPNDGRVVSNFIIQTLQNLDLTIYGDGTQTRSFQYIDDLVEGLVTLMNHPSNYVYPVNIGNPSEQSIGDLADMIRRMIPSSTSNILYLDPVKDDPVQRQPDISLAWNTIQWQPQHDVKNGLEKTIQYFKKELEDFHDYQVVPTGPNPSKPGSSFL